MKLRSIVPLFAVLAALVAAAPAARAQSDVLRARELREAPPRLYDAIAQLRPSWLQLAGDSAAQARVVVYLNGRHVGDTRVLHTIQTQTVTQVRLRNPEFVRRTDPAFPRDEFDAAIFVGTSSGPVSSRTGRVTVSLDAGFNVASFPRVMDAALADAGYDAKVLVRETGSARFEDPGPSRPASLGATVQYGLSGPWGVALAGVYTLPGWSGGYSAEANQAVSADVTTTEVALLATRETSAVRLGVGPVYRQVQWDWAASFCQCVNEQSGSGGAAGVAAEGLLALPLGSRVVPAFRVLARYYPSQDAEYETLAEPVDVGGFVLTMGLGFVTRF